jgi:phospholipid/cholesterol/gamma-HCH transport system substrate-binding protein
MNFKLELTVGAFIAMGLACVLVLAFASTNSADRLGGETYLVTARFANTGELKPRAPVKIAGVKVGEVAALVLDPAKFEAVATLRLSKAAGELPADSSAAIYTAGLLGERYIGLSPGGDPEPLADGDEIYLTQSAVVLEQLIGKYLFSGGDVNSGDTAGDKADAGLDPAAVPAADTPVEPAAMPTDNDND